MLAYDADLPALSLRQAGNHLAGVSGPGVSASFVYDGDGNRVKGTVGSTTTAYIGNYFEWICLHSLRSFRQTIAGSMSTMKKYRCNGKSRFWVKTPSRQGRIPIPRVGGELGTVVSEDGRALILGMMAAKGTHSQPV